MFGSICSLRCTKLLLLLLFFLGGGVVEIFGAFSSLQKKLLKSANFLTCFLNQTS